jgi:tetrahydromethanopterin S-methyltransferase subunit A
VLKVNPPPEYPPEPGRYTRGNDFSPAAVCVILDTFDFAIPPDLQELVMAGLDAGAALAGMLQTENVGLEKVLCNIVANPNIRYLILCGRESAGHLPGQTIMALKDNGVDAAKRIIGSNAPTAYLANLPENVISRFRDQIVTVVNMLTRPGATDRSLPGLNMNSVAEAVRACYQESPAEFMGYALYDMGAYAEPPIVYRIAWKLAQTWGSDQLKRTEVSWLAISKLLPGTDCKQCGETKCTAFAIKVAKGKRRVDECPPLLSQEHADLRQALIKLLE